ncbi:MAG TPA: DUF2339 domain-containing protein [Hydrogenophaga sp.]|nr:DUF2339 domain-containing protein [Hydrogenophaga sp.]
MILWGIFWGAVVGALTSYDFFEGLVPGALLGLAAGLSLRRALNKWLQAQRKLWETEAGISRDATPLAAQAQAPGVASAQDNERRPPPLKTEPPAQADVAPLPSTLPTPEGIAPALAAAELTDAAWQTKTALDPVTKVSTPATRTSPSPLDSAFTAARAWLLGGNTMLRVGLLILFIGLAFLARQAAHMGLLPVELRLAGIGMVGAALLVFGFRQRLAKPGLSLTLQGGGVAVLYLTVFAAFKLYGLIPPLPAFGLMVVICALSCALALLQNAHSLAVAAFLGGFATPVLLSTGGGSHVALFAYYLLLNLAILFIAYKRSWRLLNLVGFFSTFVIAGLWGVLSYRPEHYASAQPFLIAFVLIFIAASVLYARNTPTQLGNTVDSTLVFGTPLIGFGLQAGLVASMPFGQAFSAVGFGFIYLTLAWVLKRRGGASSQMLMECFLALGAGFATLAVPLALDARWVSVVWALEGLGAFWVGMRQARWMPRAAGLLLVAVAALLHLDGLAARGAAHALLNPALWHGLVLALAILLMAWWLRAAPLPHSGSRWAAVFGKLEGALSAPMFLVGVGDACLAWLTETTRLAQVTASGLSVPVYAEAVQPASTMLGWVVAAAGALWLGQKKPWPVATWPARVMLPALLLACLWQGGQGAHVLQWPLWLMWAIALALHVWALRRLHALHGETGIDVPRWLHALHAGSAWLICLLLADALWMAIDAANLWRSSWASVVWLLSGVTVLAGLCLWAGRAHRPEHQALRGWPLNPYAPAYYAWAAAPLALLVFIGALWLAWTSPGDTRPLPYVPLINPVEIVLALSMVVLLLWRRTMVSAEPRPQLAHWLATTPAPLALAALGFVALNTVWLRVAHHFFAVPWRADALFESFVVQTGYAILWSLLAMALMLVAHRRALRPWWMAGAALQAVVVVKLMLIDLSNAGGMERTVAFIAVGVLMLLVGYFAPLPPKADSPPATNDPAAEAQP